MTDALSSQTFTAFGPIDLDIVGDVAALYDLSRTMSTISARLSDVANRVALLPDNLSYFWEGKSFDSFARTATEHASAITTIADFARDASSVVDAYGGMIERGRQHFADYADAASRSQLAVSEGRFIHPPSTVNISDCAINGSDRNARTNYQYQVTLFREIGELVTTWRTDLEVWITEYFGPLLGRTGDLEAIDALIGRLRDAGMSTFDALAEQTDKRVSTQLSDFLDQQREFEDRWREHQKDGRSGDPARAARAEIYDEAAHSAARDSVDAEIKKLGTSDFLVKGAKSAGVLGGIAAAAYDISQGESPSKVAAGVAGGAVGGIAGASAGTVVAPGLGTVVGAIIGWVGGSFGGYYGGQGGTWLWENMISLRSRQSIDEGLAQNYRLAPGLDPHSAGHRGVYGWYGK